MSMITEVTSVSSKGQVVLPKTIRDALSLDTGSKLIVVTDGDNISIIPHKFSTYTSMVVSGIL